MKTLTPAERQRVLFDWNRTASVLPGGCLHHLAEAAARSDPGAPAIFFQRESISYGDLMLRANRLASVLHQNGVGGGSIVALYLSRSPEFLAAQLAVLKTGAAWLPIDRAQPRERRRLVLADARPDLLITLRALAGDLDGSIPVLSLEDAAAQADTLGDDSVSEGRPDDAAYVTFTSGSTGQPKGVLTRHRGAVNYIGHMIASRRLLRGERVLQFTSFAFDSSVRDTLGTLAFGGTIVLLDDTQAHDPRALLAAIREREATLILSVVPTMLRALTRAALAEGAVSRTLRLIMASGEPLMRSDVENARLAFGPGIQIVNQYGATECSMVSADYPVPAEIPSGAASLPVGRPIGNCRIYILNQDLDPVAAGEEGELYIGGVGVGAGYLNRRELTTERFRVDPWSPFPEGRMYRTGDLARHLPDGAIQYLGRADHQVKIKGHRVELGEIESVLREHPSVRDAAVVLWQGSGRERLAAYVTPSGDTRPGDLREFLALRLPLHMLPDSFALLEELPLTPNGKIDRRRLTRPGEATPAGRPVHARNLVEARLVTVWESVLGVTPIGMSDDFFELGGGDSLKAVEMFARMETVFGHAPPVSALLQHGTVEALAKVMEQEGAFLHPGVVPLQQQGTRVPLFLALRGFKWVFLRRADA